jgi:hypothetical protein
MCEQPGPESIPVGMRPFAQYLIGHLLMLRERLTYQQWSSFERSADIICNNVLKQMPVDHPGSAIWGNRRERGAR